MEIIDINAENVGAAGGIIPPDIAENIGRTWFRGIVTGGEDGAKKKAGVVWEYKNAGDDEVETKSEITWVLGESEEALNTVLSSYHAKVKSESATCSEFELPLDHQAVMLEKVLSEDGFNIRNSESMDVYVTVGELARLKLGKSREPFYIQPLKQLKFRQFKNGMIDCLFLGKKGLLEDFAWISKEWFEQSISSCVVMDETVKGFLLVHKTITGNLIVELLFSAGADPRKYLLEMIRFSIKMTIKNYPSGTKILLRRHNEAVRSLVKKLFPEKKGAKVMAGNRQEIKGGASE